MMALDGSDVQLDAQVLVFVHADCPTSLLALRHLAGVERGAVVVAEETPEAAARLARRGGVRLLASARDRSGADRSAARRRSDRRLGP
jgi:hypothetical protein